MSIIDEVTNEEIGCTYCEKKDGCGHLLLNYDITFATCDGGYAYGRLHELTGPIEATFLRQMKVDPEYQYDDMKALLRYLWGYSVENYTGEEEEDDDDDFIEMDTTMLLELINEYFISAGDVYSRGGVFDDMPGQSSANLLIYAKEPEKVFDKAKQALYEELKKGFPDNVVLDASNQKEIFLPASYAN